MYLLDTCIFSEAQRRSPEALAWLRTVPAQSLFVSALSLGEMELGIEKLRQRREPKAAKLEMWLAGIRAVYQDRILTVDEEIALAWGRMMAVRSRPVVDALIAATALVHRKIVVTRNEPDFSGSGVLVHNPWAR